MNRLSLFRAPLLLLGVALALSACDASLDDAPDAAGLTEAEIAEATQIIGEALSEDGGGLLASARDLTASLTADGLVDGPDAVRGHRDRHPRRCRGGEFSLTYQEDTGTHLVTYECSVENDHGQKSFFSQLAYRYRDAEGGFIEHPVQDWDLVDSVAFGGVREGLIEAVRNGVSHSATFEQQGQWALSGLADDTATAILGGSQERTGTRTRTGPDGSVSRSYSVALSGEGIEITEGEDGLGRSAVGELDYVLTIEVIRGDHIRTRTVEGTIQLEEHGRALLRIIGIRGVYRVSLGDGATDLVS